MPQTPNGMVITSPTGRMIIAGAGVAAFMNILDGTIVTVSLPTMIRNLAVGTGSGILVLLAYTIMLAGTVLMFGKIADRWGMRRLMMTGFALFTASSLVCGLAPSLAVLVVGRLLQGIGGGMLSATSLGAIGYYFSPTARGTGIGIISACSALGATLGAPLGGILSEALGWRWIFLVNVPVGLMALWIVHFRFPHDPDRKAVNGPVVPDLLGVLLSLGTLTLLLFTISQGSAWGWLSPVILGGFLLAFLFGSLFFIHEHRCDEPLLDLALFTDRHFRLANLANVFTSMFIGGLLFLLPFYLILVSGLGQAVTGQIMLLFSGVYVLVSPLAGRVADRIGTRILTTGGMGMAVLAIVILLSAGGTSGLGVPVIFLVLIGIAYGAYLSPNNRQIMLLAPEEKQGTAAGIVRFFFYLGQPTGVALVESFIRKGIPVEMTSTVLVSTATFRYGFLVCCVLAGLSAVCSFFAGGARSRPDMKNRSRQDRT